ncbi:Gliding motility-associated ABC transporter ATP-binding protein GldA [hydrothermal vent metagenome]|uniref:Gliding motility-associated ABC transporter ATP-binding protein GldA n=1 Tax=hydrothermal vent metagenome TaxID=652676 RepID=A0A3B1BGM9_9ZZZZ
MIEVERLTKDYGQFRALDDISFSVAKGEIMGFLGPNGAGKTTMMRILTCFFPATRGRAMVAGFDCFEDSLKVRERIGYLPERVPLYEDMKVTDYLSFAAAAKGVPAKEVKQSVAKAVGEFGLQDVASRMISACSRGYRQRVGLAQAVVNDPDVLILDEPTVGLDPKQIKEIRKIIKELAGKRTVILSTHILPEVSLLCDRVIIINKGKLIAVDKPENLTGKKSQKLLLRIDGSMADIEKAIAKVKGVKSVDREQVAEGELGGLILDFEDEKVVKKQVQALIAQNNWDLIEMRPIEVSLEDCFIDLITKEEA